ncbi:hypothetical protein PVAP13_8NG177601 [Panicum virgatum]|uniref:Uncharacterized protein n=1 Tax=Panicum virgatum TaxID=38727 RepID=A0A8T0P8N5_PANVG|nr:hypothetical protein PVAP13_8NG177601 [Panicum virgatum]
MSYSISISPTRSLSLLHPRPLSLALDAPPHWLPSPPRRRVAPPHCPNPAPSAGTRERRARGHGGHPGAAVRPGPRPPAGRHGSGTRRVGRARRGGRHAASTGERRRGATVTGVRGHSRAVAAGEHPAAAPPRAPPDLAPPSSSAGSWRSRPAARLPANHRRSFLAGPPPPSRARPRQREGGPCGARRAATG